MAATIRAYDFCANGFNGAFVAQYNTLDLWYGYVAAIQGFSTPQMFIFVWQAPWGQQYPLVWNFNTGQFNTLTVNTEPVGQIPYDIRTWDLFEL